MSGRKSISVAIQNIAIVVGSYVCGFYFTKLFHEPTSYVGGLWAVISGIIVLESTARNTLNSAKTRIIGTLIGAIISGIYLLFFEFSILGYSVCIAIGVLLCYLFKIQHAVKLTGVTISVILIVSTIEQELHPIKNAGLRFAESLIGTGIAILAAYIVYLIHKSDNLEDS